MSRQQQIIIDYLSTHHNQGSTFNDISRDTGLRISSITARINELRKKEIVYLYGKTIDQQTTALDSLIIQPTKKASEPKKK
jgi:DNA-binding MarR family transcriptional regulator